MHSNGRLSKPLPALGSVSVRGGPLHIRRGAIHWENGGIALMSREVSKDKGFLLGSTRIYIIVFLFCSIFVLYVFLSRLKKGPPLLSVME